MENYDIKKLGFKKGFLSTLNKCGFVKSDIPYLVKCSDATDLGKGALGLFAKTLAGLWNVVGWTPVFMAGAGGLAGVANAYRQSLAKAKLQSEKEQMHKLDNLLKAKYEMQKELDL